MSEGLNDMRKVIHFLSSPAHEKASEALCSALSKLIDRSIDDQAKQRRIFDSLFNAAEAENLQHDANCVGQETPSKPASDSTATGPARNQVVPIHEIKVGERPQVKTALVYNASERSYSNKAIMGGSPGSRKKRIGRELMSRRRSVQQSFLVIKQSRYLLPQDHPIRISWDTYMMLLILYYALLVPIRVAFACYEVDCVDDIAQNVALENFFTACFMFDILLNFNTSIKIKNEVVLNRRKIAQDYLRKWFWIDLLASFPFEALPTAETESGSVNKLGRLPKLFRLFRILKLLRVLKLGRILTRLRQSFQVNPNVLLLLRTIATMLFTLHMAACGYWLIVNLEGDVNGNDDPDGLCDPSKELNHWHPPQNIKNHDGITLQYFYAFFWGVSVTTGAGWDIIPNTLSEVLYSSLMIIFGTMLYITIIGSVTSIVSNINVTNSKKMQQLDSLNAYLKTRLVSRDMQKKIRGYYEFMWDEGVDSDASQYIQSLPNSLQVGLAQEMHRSILSKISIFADLPSEAIFFLVQNWARSVFMPKDVIVWEGDVIDRLYIVLRGGVTVSVRHGYTRLVIAELKEGAFFGETAMLASDPIAQQHTVRTNGFCEVLFLTKGMYEEMMLKYQLNTSLGYILAAESKKREIRMRWKKAIAQVRAVNRLRRASTAPTDLDDSTRKMLAEIGRES